MGSTNARGTALAKAVEEKGPSCTSSQDAFREVCLTLLCWTELGHMF